MPITDANGMPLRALNGGCVREVFEPAGFCSLPVLQTRTWLPPITLQVMSGSSSQPIESVTMLKIVPDPPHDIHSLEDTLIQATDYALCAATVVHQAMLLPPKSPASVLMMTSMHELETLRALLESALIQVQMPTGPRTLH